VATYIGDGGANTLTGTEVDDLLQGLGGDDILNGKGGADTLEGDNDTLTESGGDDILDGGDGDDSLVGGSGNDTLTGGGGNDIFKGGNGNDVFLSAGLDQGSYTVNGGSGNDTILGSAGDDVIGLAKFSGGNTVEVIDGNGRFNIIRGDANNNTLNFLATTLIDIDRIERAKGNDNITGSTAADTLSSDGTEAIVDLGGNDDLLVLFWGWKPLYDGDVSASL